MNQDREVRRTVRMSVPWTVITIIPEYGGISVTADCPSGCVVLTGQGGVGCRSRVADFLREGCQEGACSSWIK